MALSRALEDRLTEAEPPILQRPQRDARYDEVAAQISRIDRMPDEVGDDRQMLGLYQGYVPRPLRVHGPVGAMVTGEPEPPAGLRCRHRLDLAPLAPPQADPLEASGLGDVLDELAGVATGSWHRSRGYPPTLPWMLRCYHDYPSAASAVVVRRLQRIADEGGRVVFEGFETHPADRPFPVTLPVLAEREQWQDRAAAVGLELGRPSNVPPTADAHAIGVLADGVGLGASWREVAYRAYWEEAADLADRRQLVELARRAGLDLAEVTELLDDPTARARMRATAARRRSAGVGGVPVLEVSGALVPADLSEEELRTLAG